MALGLRRPYRRQTTAEAGPEDAAADEQAATRPGTGRVAAARGAWAMGSVMTLIARLVRLVTAIVVLIILAAIVLRLLGANPSNSIVRGIHDAGRALVGPFHNVFTIKDPKASIAANWGLAAAVYLIVGSFIASLISRLAPAGVHPSRPVT